jgi:O-antigen ligase/polysaccharide polymerase Wzy-like membrane protein
METDTLSSTYIAYLALLIWLPIGIVLFLRLPITEAILWTILGGFLLLPVGTYFKFHGLPISFDKRSIPSLVALIGCALIKGYRPRLFYKFSLADILIVSVIIGPFVTSTLNGDPIRYRHLVLDGVGPYDGISTAILQCVILVPFFLGRQFLRSAEGNVSLLRALALAGLIYTLPMLFEVRMSPQLHIWIYGFPPHSFLESVRGEGFRPMVFIGGGLQVAFFLMTTIVATSALARMRIPVVGLAAGPITAYLGVVLLLCKTLSAIIYAMILVPLVSWASPRRQVLVASVLVAFAIAYPVLRVADLVPTNSMLKAASMVSADRAASLQVRFDQEKMLLDRALQRPWFGWGRYGRNRVFSPDGTDLTIIDGYWVNVLGSFGLVGFLSVFGLIGLSVFRAATAIGRMENRREQICFAALALLVAVNIVNLLPNTTITPCTWLLVGALLGRAEMLHASARQRRVVGSSFRPSPAMVERTQN